MKPTRAKKFAVMATGVTILFVGAVVTLRALHAQAPGSGHDPWRDICVGILIGLLIIELSLGFACIVRCESKPESEQDRCKWLCTLATVALSALLFALMILWCAPPSLPSGPTP